MHRVRLGAAATALLCSGCVQLSAVVRLNGNGSGTIAYSLRVTTAAIAQIRQLAALAGNNGDPLSEDRLRLAAATMGPGVSVVSVTATRTDTGEGRDVVYAFDDVNQLRLSPPGLQARPDAAGARESRVAFALAHTPDGHALLRIALPLPNVPGLIAPRPMDRRDLSADRLAELRQMYAGMQVGFAVEPAGTLVGTSSPFVDGRRVTLIDLDFDRFLEDEQAVARLQNAATLEAIKAALKDAPGARVCLDREITIEFAPDTP